MRIAPGRVSYFLFAAATLLLAQGAVAQQSNCVADFADAQRKAIECISEIRQSQERESSSFYSERYCSTFENLFDKESDPIGYASCVKEIREKYFKEHRLQFDSCFRAFDFETGKAQSGCGGSIKMSGLYCAYKKSLAALCECEADMGTRCGVKTLL